MIDKAPRATLAAIVKITLFVLAPVYAAFTTLRVGMTTLGLDHISWSQWPEEVFGPMGMNFAIPLFFLALLGPSGTTSALWRALRDVPRVYATAPRRPGANLPKAVLTIIVFTAGPVGAVWLAPEAWTSWWTWICVGLLVALPAVWGMASPLGPDQWRAIVALSVGVTLTATANYYLHLEAAVAGILWPYPMMSILNTYAVGALAMHLVTPRGKTPFKTES